MGLQFKRADLNHLALKDIASAGIVHFIITNAGAVKDKDGNTCKSWDEVYALVKPWLESYGVSFETNG